MEYRMDIRADDRNIQSLSIRVPKDQNHSEKIRFPVQLNQSQPHQITVSLRNRKESLHFWTEVKKESEEIIPKAVFDYRAGNEQATGDWTVSKGTPEGNAKLYRVSQPETNGYYLKAVFTLPATPQNDFVFIGKSIESAGDFNSLQITAFGKNAPDSFWIKLSEQDGSIYRYNLPIDQNQNQIGIPLKDFLLTGWTQDENNKLDLKQVSRIELGFEDPRFSSSQTVAVFFTGIKFSNG